MVLRIFLLLLISISSYAQTGIFKRTTLDTDAQAFINVLSATDDRINSSINQLFLDLKANNVYTDIGALYPFIGSTAADHKWNAVNPLNTDAAYRLTFTADNSANHTSAGYTPNGTTQYADTHIIQSTFGDAIIKNGMGLYSTSIATGNTTTIMGVQNESTTIFNNKSGANVTWYINFKQSNLNNIQPGLNALFLYGPSGNNTVLTAQANIGQIQQPYHNHASGPGQSTNSLSLYLGAKNNIGTAAGFSTTNIGLMFYTKMLLGGKAYSLTKALQKFLISYKGSGGLLQNVCLYFGDSVTQGLFGENLTTDLTKYTTLTTNMLGYNEWNCGLTGTCMQSGTTADAAYGPAMVNRTAEIPIKTPNEKYLFFMFGVNDMYYLPSGASTFKTAYESVISVALANGWPAQSIVLLSTPIQINAATGATQAAYNTAISQAASDKGTQYIDIFTYMTNNGGNSLVNPDGIHPNDQGNKVIATCIALNIL